VGIKRSEMMLIMFVLMTTSMTSKVLLKITTYLWWIEDFEIPSLYKKTLVLRQLCYLLWRKAERSGFMNTVRSSLKGEIVAFLNIYIYVPSNTSISPSSSPPSNVLASGRVWSFIICSRVILSKPRYVMRAGGLAL
jgi:hypothetical protein